LNKQIYPTKLNALYSPQKGDDGVCTASVDDDDDDAKKMKNKKFKMITCRSLPYQNTYVTFKVLHYNIYHLHGATVTLLV